MSRFQGDLHEDRMALLNLRRRRSSGGLLPFDWIQVEVTSLCNASCVYCPRTAYRQRWHDRHLGLETYRKLIPSFARTRLVYLQGWGEPLLHPHFFEMARMAKEAGCLVGFTSNGSCLDEDRIREALGVPVDLIALSLAGTTDRNDLIRKGTSLSQVLGAVDRIKMAMAKTQGRTPAVHIAYMLLRSNLAEAEAIPQVLKGSAVDQVVISTLDFVPDKSFDGETFRRDDPDLVEVEEFLNRVKARGAETGIRIHYRPLASLRPQRCCAENVYKALFVAADGEVAPCAYLNIPVEGVSHVSAGREAPYQRLTFGRIYDEGIDLIWAGDEYVRFRTALASGDPVAQCRDCPKRYSC